MANLNGVELEAHGLNGVLSPGLLRSCFFGFVTQHAPGGGESTLSNETKQRQRRRLIVSRSWKESKTK